MSLLKELSKAVLEPTQQQGQPADAIQADGPSSGAVQALLQQLADSISSIQQAQRQQGTPSTANRAQEHGSVLLAANPVQAVQAGLQSSNEQLQQLLLQQRRTTPVEAPRHWEHQQHGQPLSCSTTACEACSAGGASTAVLQKLLQLAVGDVTCSQQAGVTVSTTGQLLGLGSLSPSAHPHQQQQWVQAAWEAMQLFSFQELAQLPPHSLQQALLLQPGLLVDLLEAAAAAVLQPVLSAAGSESPVRGPCTAQASGSAQQPQQGSSTGGSGAGSMKSMQSVLAASCPWMSWLPGMLAHNPLLLLQASSTLLSWLELSGHNRLWQLLSITCRPAWQKLAAGPAAASCESPPDTAAATIPAARHSGSSSATGSTGRTGGAGFGGKQEHLELVGALQLLCPEAWQQELVCLLAQEPSVLGLIQLLQQLPGLALQQQQDSPAHKACTTAELPGAGATAAAADALSSVAALTWPDPEEWGQAMVLDSTAGMDAAGEAHTTDVRLDRQHQPGQSVGTAPVAWGLLMQHYRWYQFACYLLVHSSLCHMQRQQEQQRAALAPQQEQQEQQKQEQVWLSVQQHVQQLLQMPLESLLQQGPLLPDDQLATCAAAFIAWVQQPVGASRQQCVQQQLLAPVMTCGASRGVVQQQQQQQQDKSFLQLATSLLHMWSSPTGAVGCSSAPVITSLVEMDLPCAALQQRELLLECSPQQLVGLCLDAVQPYAPKVNSMGLQPSAHHQEQQQMLLQQAPCQQAHPAGGSSLSTPATHPPGSGSAPVRPQPSAAAICQLLDTSNELCAAALEVVNLSMRQRLQQQSGLAQHASGIGGGFNHSWLAGQWLQARSSVFGDTPAKVQSAELSVAKQLLSGATSVDTFLKQQVLQLDLPAG